MQDPPGRASPCFNAALRRRSPRRPPLAASRPGTPTMMRTRFLLLALPFSILAGCGGAHDEDEDPAADPAPPAAVEAPAAAPGEPGEAPHVATSAEVDSADSAYARDL